MASLSFRSLFEVGDEHLFSRWVCISHLPGRRFSSQSQNVASHANWVVMSRIGWIATTGLVAFLLWQIAMAQPLWPPAVSGLLLTVIGILAGLRFAQTQRLHIRRTCIG